MRTACTPRHLAYKDARERHVVPHLHGVTVFMLQCCARKAIEMAISPRMSDGNAPWHVACAESSGVTPRRGLKALREVCGAGHCLRERQDEEEENSKSRESAKARKHDTSAQGMGRGLIMQVYP